MGRNARAECVTETVRRALREDVGAGDVTSRALVPARARARAEVVAREGGVLSGLDVARTVFRLVSPALRATAGARDGDPIRAGDVVLRLDGPARAILTGERTALNFIQRLSGIATLTRAFVEAVRPLPVRILDTRKTTPGLRALEKAAVAHGGGTNHRFGLYDRVLIKDNHIAFWRAAGRGASLADAVRAARRRAPGLEVEIEVESEADLRDALEGNPDWVLLDNMTPAQLRRCVRIAAGRAKLEASGGITLRSARRVAASGVDALSVGALTHSARALDFALDWL